MSFPQLRSQALQLEKQTESHLSKLASNPEEQLQIQSLLERREQLLIQLNRSYEGNSVSKSQQLNRHNEILNEHNRLFLQMKSRLDEERSRHELLDSIQSDISQHRQQNDADYILDERQRVDGANSLAERLLEQAFNTRDELLNQRQYLDNAQVRILGTLQQIPGINVLISKINTRRRRDSLILALVISACILVIWFF